MLCLGITRLLFMFRFLSLLFPYYSVFRGVLVISAPLKNLTSQHQLSYRRDSFLS
jgi:hypothetical protein